MTASTDPIQLPYLPPELSRPLRKGPPDLLERARGAQYKLNEAVFLRDRLRDELASQGSPVGLFAYTAAALGACRSVMLRMERTVEKIPTLKAWLESEQRQRGFPWKDSTNKKTKWQATDSTLMALKLHRDFDVHEDDLVIAGAVTQVSMVGSAEPPMVTSRDIWIVWFDGQDRKHVEVEPALMHGIRALQDFVTAYLQQVEAHIAATQAAGSTGDVSSQPGGNEQLPIAE